MTTTGLYGEEREDRDVLVYMLWERGVFTNEETGNFFAMSYSAVSYVVRRIKGRLKEDKGWQREKDLTNLQIKM